ncbi:MAG: hypothetical protein ACK8QZ_07565 [Anaerolineales bacterium]
MRIVKLSTLILAIIGVGIGLVAVKGNFLQAVGGPTPTPVTLEQSPPEIPMPTAPLVQGVLATLPPVEAGKLIQPPTALSSRLLYLSYEDKERLHYYIVDLQTGEKRELGPFPPPQDEGEFLIHASPTGERIVYSVYFDLFALDPVVGIPEAREMGMGSIWLMNPDGSNKRQLVGSDELRYPVSAIWSPDGQEIAFLRLPDPRAVEQGKLKAEQAELWVMNADGSEQRKVADLPYLIEHNPIGGNPSMRWLLDDHIYIVTTVASKGDWLRINPHTGEVTRLMEGVEPWEVEISPDTRWIVGMSGVRVTALGRQPLHLPGIWTWDPTGARVAFVNLPFPYGDKSLEPGIWVMDLQEGKQNRLSAVDVTSTPCGQLSWSPDGKMLLCDSIEGLYVIWIDRDESRMVVQNPLAKEDAVGIKFVGWIPVSTRQP